MLRIILLMTILAPSVTFANGIISVCMSEDQRSGTGISKLTTAEIRELSLWLGARGFICRCSSTSSCTTEANSAEFSVRTNNDQIELETKIVGLFSGWTGDTIFTLSDGSQWQQRSKGVKQLNLMTPEVTIFKNWLGFYEMRINVTGDVVKVRKAR